MRITDAVRRGAGHPRLSRPTIAASRPGPGPKKRGGGKRVSKYLKCLDRRGQSGGKRVERLKARSGPPRSNSLAAGAGPDLDDGEGNWSEWRDSNPRPLVPQTSALTGLRYTPTAVLIVRAAAAGNASRPRRPHEPGERAWARSRWASAIWARTSRSDASSSAAKSRRSAARACPIGARDRLLRFGRLGMRWIFGRIAPIRQSRGIAARHTKQRRPDPGRPAP